ncbi:MAG: clostripain-related cysteine peptidase [Candidatus Babeliaceae bacterium]
MKKSIMLPFLLLATSLWGEQERTTLLSDNIPAENKINSRIDYLISKAAANIFQPRTEKIAQSKWLFYVMAAARNDLEPYFWRNLEQMKKIGSNENCTVVIRLDLYRKRGKRITKHLIVRKGYVEQIGPDLSLDSGDENALISELRWINNNFIFDKLAINFWNHGSGDVNPIMGKIFNPSYLFYFNPETQMLELDRSISFLDFIDKMAGAYAYADNQRGVCFDDSTGHFLDDKKLITAFNTFCMQDRKGKKIDVVFFDACLMAGVGTQSILHKFANYMVASEEAEMGWGYPYDLILAPFAKQDLSPADFAKHVVTAYDAFYKRITGDYTQSAIDLNKFSQLNENINNVSSSLIQALQLQQNNSVSKYIGQCYHATVQFEEPTYIDLGDFYNNLLKNINSIQLQNKQQTQIIVDALTKQLNYGLMLIAGTVIENATGKNLLRAQGISIYLPQNQIYPTYANTQFAQTNNWYQFLKTYLA